MFYASQEKAVVRSTIGDSLYNYIHEKTDDGSDYLIKVFHTRREADAYIRCRNEEHPQDELYEHWYVKKTNVIR